MKKLIVLIIATITGIPTIFSQVNYNWNMPYDTVKKIFIYDEVIQVPGIKKDELFKRAEDWISMYFTSGAKKVFEKDQAQGLMKLNNRFTLMKTFKGQIVNDVIINYRMEIYVKDGRFRYQIYKFYAGVDANALPIEKWMGPTFMEEEKAKERYKNIDVEIQKAITSLKDIMKNGKPVKNDDW